MEKPPRELTPEQQKSQQRCIDNMICNLFWPSNLPLFNGSGIPSASALDEFTRCNDVLVAASHFTDSLKRIWIERYPTTTLLESSIYPTEMLIGEPQLFRMHRTGIDNMIWGLFWPSDFPFFNRSGIPPGIVDEFVKNESVLTIAKYFANSLLKIWKTQYSAVAASLPITLIPEETAMHSPTIVPEAVANIAENKPKQSITPSEESEEIPIHSTQAEKTAPSEPASLPSRQSSTPSARTSVWKPTNPIATFQVPNAKSGLEYNGKIAEAGAAPRSIQFRNVRLPPGSGLTLSNENAGELAGTPSVPGDHKIIFQWSEDGGKSWSSGECVLIVNPDPRSLWKIGEPPENAPYKKDHIDKKLISAIGFNIAAASRRGRSHEHSATFRDDDFFVHHDTVSGWSVLIVADGAGSAKSSRWGSKLAVEAAGEHLVSNLAGEIGSNMNTALNGWDANPAVKKTMNDAFYLLFQKAASLAVEAIEAEAKSKNVPVKEYSTTLLAAAVKRQEKETFLATFWMGDGAIAAYGPRTKVRLMGAPDGGEFAGQTRFLDRAALIDKDFSKRVKIGCFPDILSVMLMTDGISDPKFETDNGLKDATKWDALWDEIASCLTSPEPDKSLVEWLHFFTPGHHDDRTIALLW
ncbi:MAG: PP2C family serine/threonine-protein phosphatase [Sulfuricellaceae bacterium]